VPNFIDPVKVNGTMVIDTDASLYQEGNKIDSKGAIYTYAKGAPFGAKGDGETDDTTAIQAAINASANKVLVLEEGTYKITAPLVISGKITIIGMGRDREIIIKKTTNTVGSGSNMGTTGVTDSYAVDAVFIFKHSDSNYTRNVELENLVLTANTNAVYGIYAPRTAYLQMKNIHTDKCDYGFFTYESFMTTMERFTSDICTSCIKYSDDGSGNAGSTSLVATNCYAESCKIGYDFYALSYSSLISCACDNAIVDTNHNKAYQFSWCRGISMIGCGCEVVLGDALNFWQSTVTVHGFRAQYLRGSPQADTSAAVQMAGGGRYTFTACHFDNYQTVNQGFNIIIQDGCLATFIESTLPTNGQSFINVAYPSLLTMIDDKGITVQTRNGTLYSGIVQNGHKILYGTAAPSNGTWAVGDRIVNSSPAAGGSEGWVCVSAGSPGTWKTYGTIQA
jgi:hypothetical protein